MNKSPSTTCARHDNGTASELWRSLSYQVGDTHAHRICRCIDVYCRIVGLPVERLRSHVPGQTPAGPTPQRVVAPGFKPIAQALEELRAMMDRVRGDDGQPGVAGRLGQVLHTVSAALFRLGLSWRGRGA